ncbi:LOW QUALITY PROTEIN: NACHT, LRR and PYD domains-containing protein 6 [Tyto alba]|uniref:LOW QUALITY PROTEIN: NACHT, LRR and PYD domains-containing protein 6 n=1 Tax=Tyto alba TaxID=56313 RepID=UPI001C664A35|nr:LOW QUALITY PROTEIN: NACHT, LRR and PYD domains-containing protein 6 [Tyto alba]
MEVHDSRICAPSSSSPQSTAGDLLLRALEDLSESDFKRFRDALARGNLQGVSCIPWGRLEKADWIDTKNLMLDFYGKEAVLDVAIAVFEHIQLRNTAALLRESREKALRSAPLLGPLSPGRRGQGEAQGALPPLTAVRRRVRWPPTLPDYRRDYKKAVLQAYSRMKDQNARVGDGVSLNARYSKLVIVNKHRDEEQREHEIMAMGRRHAEIMKEQANSSIAVGDLFNPCPDGWTPKVVVLLGAAGVGKTMTARKIMVDWASEKVFVAFDYVFYIHCRERNLLTRQASMADLIAQCCPGSSPPLADVLGQPEKLLFVIDGFDELRFSFDRPESELCSQPWEQQPVEITLSSLFRRRLLPESSLLVTTRPAALQKLGNCLDCERYAEILGFSEAERKDYFHRFFENTEQAAAAFQFIRGNETLFTMCLVPIVCWIVCTVMKQQLGRAEGLTRSPKTTTGIYILYLSALLQSLNGQVKQGMPRVLRRLCCLAANGIWKQKVLFEEEEVHGYALDQRALPLLLNENLFQKDISCVSTYSFIHLSFQEFFAALFYLLEDEGEAQELPASPSRDVKELLESYGNSRNYFMLTVRFLFGLLNKERRRELEEKMGCKIAPRITQELLAWLQNSQKTALALLMEETAVIRELEVCHCLYELQDEHFVVTALDPFTGVYLRGLNLNRFDQMVLSFSVKNFPNLESLDLGNCSFLRDDPEDCVGPRPAKQPYWDKQQEEGKQSPIHLLCQALDQSGCKLKTLRFDRCQLTGACCRALAPVLSVNPTLTELDLAGNEDLRDGGVKLLCQGLRCGSCQLQTLRLGCCNITAAGCKDLAALLSTVPSLAELDLSDNPLGDDGVREVCEALTEPGGSVQKLWLWQCRLTEESCGALAAVLPASPSLTELHLGDNELGDGGVRRLSEGLRDPACRLRTLRLWQCRLTEESCGALAAVLPASPSLTELHLGDNELGDGGVRRLSEGLRDPACRLRTLSLWQCRLTGGCCKDLCAVLGTSRSLEHLDVSENSLGDGSARLLCEALGQPSCALRTLWLKKAGLTGETLQKLHALKEVKPNLNVEYI